MKSSFLCLVASVLMSVAAICNAQTAVTTYQIDNYRSGANTHETTLTPSNVNMMQFGRRAVFPVQGHVYAQPLYVPNLNINGQMHNVLYVATEHDQVYAFDVNSGQQLWQKNLLITTGPLLQVTPVSSSDVGCGDLVPEIGITGTPVIDLANNEIFVVTKTKERDLVQQTTNFFQTIYALDLRTGNLRNPPRRVNATFPGTGWGSHNGILTFDPLIEGQRSALMLMNGQIFIGWASHCDLGLYHGWVMAFNSFSLFTSGVWVDTPNGREGGFWAGGSGPTADSSGGIYLSTGNGNYNGTSDFGDSVVRLSWARGAGFSFVDYFTPWDQSSLDGADRDQGSGGVLLLPDQPGSRYPHLLVNAGKEGTIDLINRDNMGHFHSGNDSQIVQTLVSVIGGSFGAAAFWNNTLYYGGTQDALKAFAFDPVNQQLSTGPTSRTPQTFNFPGTTPAISSNGLSNGIVWAIERNTGNGIAILHAYSATALNMELYNSQQNPSRDSAGAPVKFTVPTVADGHVFVGAQNQVAMYGLLQ